MECTLNEEFTGFARFAYFTGCAARLQEKSLIGQTAVAARSLQSFEPDHSSSRKKQSGPTNQGPVGAPLDLKSSDVWTQRENHGEHGETRGNAIESKVTRKFGLQRSLDDSACVHRNACAFFLYLPVSPRILDQPASASWMVLLQNRCAVAVLPAYNELAEQLPKEPQLHVDESPTKEGKTKAWVWTFVAASFTFFKCATSRAADVATKVLGEDYDGIIHCDRARTKAAAGLLAMIGHRAPVRFECRQIDQQRWRGQLDTRAAAEIGLCRLGAERAALHGAFSKQPVHSFRVRREASGASLRTLNEIPVNPFSLSRCPIRTARR